MSDADEIRKQLQAAKDEIVRTVSVCHTRDYQTLVDTGLLERLVNDMTNLERQLVEMENVKIKMVLIHDIPTGSLYYLQVKRGYEREFLAHNFVCGFIPVE